MCQSKEVEELAEGSRPAHPRAAPIAPASRWSWPWRVIAAAAAGGASWALLASD